MSRDSDYTAGMSYSDWNRLAHAIEGGWTSISLPASFVGKKFGGLALTTSERTKLRTDLLEWCKINCAGEFIGTQTRVYFQESRDATLFSLRWS